MQATASADCDALAPDVFDADRAALQNLLSALPRRTPWFCKVDSRVGHPARSRIPLWNPRDAAHESSVRREQFRSNPEDGRRSCRSAAWRSAVPRRRPSEEGRGIFMPRTYEGVGTVRRPDGIVGLAAILSLSSHN